MNAPNHIAGGLAFTGIFSSFFDINIFENFTFLFVAIFSSLLPDIDHTRSYLGKLFYPIAKWIDKKHGHRTITHSLLFLFGITFFTGIIESIFFNSNTITLITFFGVLSHLILDMVTVQGIPLFYPFYRNPCVIPANPTSRIRNSNTRAQAVSLFFFAFVLFTCQDLFANGFWTSYNRAFGTIKHVFAESRNNPKKLLVDYSFIKNGEQKNGIAELIAAEENKLTLFDKELFEINNSDIIKHTKPIKTNEFPKLKEFSFFDLTIDSLNNLLKNKVVNGTIQSNLDFITVAKNITKKTKQITFKDEYNPKLKELTDTTKENINNQIEALNIRLKNNLEKDKKSEDEIKKLKKQKSNLIASLNETMNFYNRNKLEEKIIVLTQKIESSKVLQSNNELLLFKIKTLKSQSETNNKQFFSGIISVRYLERKSENDSVFVVRIKDGDTIEVLENGIKKSVRLAGIDAPEKKQKFAELSKNYLEKTILNKNVFLSSPSVGKYGRIIATVKVSSTDINLQLLKKGFVFHYKKYSKNEDYSNAEKFAVKNKVGIFCCDEKIEKPWIYRKKGF